ncbi:MAG: TolC family protein, partial [Ekhidna sp.]|nr:TolC family protein [Ekhidna sp.]
MKRKTGLITALLLLCFLAFSQEKRMLSLQECIDVAVENNLTVQRSELNLQGAEINLVQAQAQRAPSLNLNGNYGFNWGRGIDPTTNQFIDQRINFNGVGGNASMPILNGLQVTNGVKQSKIDKEASKFDLERSINDISLNISLFYLNIILNKELLDNARFQLESSKEQYERTKVLVESGALPLANELQLQSQVASNEVALINAQNTLDLSVLTLKQAMLLPPGEEIDIVIPEMEVDQADIENTTVLDVYKVAVENQPEMKSADLRVKSAEVGLDVSKGGLFPTLSLNGGFSTNYSDAFQEVSSVNATPTGGLNPTTFVDSNGGAIFEQEFDVNV